MQASVTGGMHHDFNLPESDEKDEMAQTVLRPLRYLDANLEAAQPTTAGMVILNSPIDEVAIVRCLFKHTSYRLCADGGANRLHDLLISQQRGQSWKGALEVAQPSAIHGDLDSLRDDVRQHYEELGIEISHDPDQYSTDFGKGINKVIENVPSISDILVLGSIGGRVDQGVGLLHELFREQKFRHPNVRFWLFSESSITVLLQPGRTMIHTPLRTGLIKRNVGILPLYGRAVITLRGFEWDVTDWETVMGGQVSTSNHIMADVVSITTDVDVLFTIERPVGGSK